MFAFLPLLNDPCRVFCNERAESFTPSWNVILRVEVSDDLREWHAGEGYTENIEETSAD